MIFWLFLLSAFFSGICFGFALMGFLLKKVSKKFFDKHYNEFISDLDKKYYFIEKDQEK